MKRILILNYEFPPLGGGGSPVAYEIAKRYVEAGNSVCVVTMGYRGLPRYEKIDGIKIFRVPSIRKRKEICQPWEQLSYIISAKLFLKRHLKDNKYDINHTHFIIPTGIVSLWLKRKYGIKYIITSHGSDVPGHNPQRFVFLHKFTKPILKRICFEAEKIVSPSNYLKETIINNIDKVIIHKLTVIPNGIDPNIYLPVKKEKIILSTGRLINFKGFQYLIKSVSPKDLRYKLHICGDGPMMSELKEMAKQSKTKIIFHGWVDNKSREYIQLLGKASIYCLFSSKENASISLLEAMSAGCAVLTSNVAGCLETVGESGLIVEPKNVEEIRGQINALISDHRLIEKLSREGRKRVLNNYSWEKVVSKYIELLNNIMANN
ncbi:MAG: Glycogen synthase [bacterium ADurb.Bin212]|nr:MAG: Glycogen synthase [bacterium ADurb.Bin212]